MIHIEPKRNPWGNTLWARSKGNPDEIMKRYVEQSELERSTHFGIVLHCHISASILMIYFFSAAHSRGRSCKANFLAGTPLRQKDNSLHHDQYCRPNGRNSKVLTYFPLIFQPGSSLSSFSASSSPSGPRPTTTSLLIVRMLQTRGAPAADAMGPIATSKSVEGGAAQSYVSCGSHSEMRVSICSRWRPLTLR